MINSGYGCSFSGCQPSIPVEEHGTSNMSSHGYMNNYGWQQDFKMVIGHSNVCFSGINDRSRLIYLQRYCNLRKRDDSTRSTQPLQSFSTMEWSMLKTTVIHCHQRIFSPITAAKKIPARQLACGYDRWLDSLKGTFSLKICVPVIGICWSPELAEPLQPNKPEAARKGGGYLN